MMVVIHLLPKLTMALSIAVEVTSHDNCSRIIGEYHHHFGNDESGYPKSDPETSLYFDLNSGNYTTEEPTPRSYFKLLEPKLSTVSSSSNLDSYDRYCTSACSVYYQKADDHGTAPKTIAEGFDCSKDFETSSGRRRLSSPTNSYYTSNFNS